MLNFSFSFFFWKYKENVYPNLNIKESFSKNKKGTSHSTLFSVAVQQSHASFQGEQENSYAHTHTLTQKHRHTHIHFYRKRHTHTKRHIQIGTQFFIFFLSYFYVIFYIFQIFSFSYLEYIFFLYFFRNIYYKCFFCWWGFVLEKKYDYEIWHLKKTWETH